MSMYVFVNTFVNVEFKGKTLKSVYPVSRDNVLLGHKIYLLNDKSELEIKQLEIAHSDEDNFYISNGLTNDSEIITTKLSGVKLGSKLKLETNTNL